MGHGDSVYPLEVVTNLSALEGFVCINSLNSWQFVVPLRAKKTNAADRANSIAPTMFALPRRVRMSSQNVPSRRAWYFASTDHCLRTASAKNSTPCASSILKDEA